MSISLGPSLTKILDTVSAASGTGTSRPLRTHGADEVVFYFQSNGTTSGGTLKIEEAAWIDSGAAPEAVYTGTWSQIGSDISASSFSGNAQLGYHIPVTSYSYVRVRISADITGGGTVTVYAKTQ